MSNVPSKANLITEHSLGVYGLHFAGRDTRTRFYLEVALSKEDVQNTSSPAERLGLLRAALWDLDYCINLSESLSVSNIEYSGSPPKPSLAAQNAENEWRAFWARLLQKPIR